MAKGPTTAANDDMEMEKIAEDELCKLQRQHRIMEIDRGTVTSGAQQTLRMQRNLIRILTQELESIMMELKMLKSTSNVMQAGRARDQLVALLKDHEHYTEEVKKQKTNIQELDFLLKQVEKEIKSLQSTGNKSEEECAKTLTNRTMVRQLENRLDTAMKKFNSVNSENCVMRMDIDSLLRDRHTFNTDWKNQLKRLMDGKTQILELVEQAITTYDQREEWCSKLEALKERAAVDYRRHCLEVRELQRQLDHSMKLEEFLRTKGTVRLTGADAKAEARRLQKEEEETRLYNNYVNILEAIKEFAGENDVEKLMQEYTRRDEENYALFNYINEVNTELKNLHDSVKMLRKNIADEYDKHEAKKQKESDSVESLTAALEVKRQTSEALKEEVQKSNDVQQTMLQHIYELAQSADCKNLSLLKLLGNRKAVSINEHNAKLYFKSLEKRIMEINNLIKIDEILQRHEALSERSPATSSRRRLPRTPRRNQQ